MRPSSPSIGCVSAGDGRRVFLCAVCGFSCVLLFLFLTRTLKNLYWSQVLIREMQQYGLDFFWLFIIPVSLHPFLTPYGFSLAHALSLFLSSPLSLSLSLSFPLLSKLCYDLISDFAAGQSRWY